MLATYHLQTMVDAKNVQSHLQRGKHTTDDQIQIVNECIEQISFADKVIINKLDLITEEELAILEEKIRVRLRFLWVLITVATQFYRANIENKVFED